MKITPYHSSIENKLSLFVREMGAYIYCSEEGGCPLK